MSQRRCLTHICTCHRGGVSLTSALVTEEVSHSHLHLSQRCLTHICTCHRGGVSLTSALVTEEVSHSHLHCQKRVKGFQDPHLTLVPPFLPLPLQSVTTIPQNFLMFVAAACPMLFIISLISVSVKGKQDIISRVPDQNGVSLLYIMLEIHHSGREPSLTHRSDTEKQLTTKQTEHRTYVGSDFTHF